VTVIVLTAVPQGLRGVLTRWLFEVAPGVFVGKVSKRVRDLLWDRIIEDIGRGRALLVFPGRNEQGMEFRTHGHDWKPTDFDGLTLIKRPHEEKVRGRKSTRPKNWSYAERRLRGRR